MTDTPPDPVAEMSAMKAVHDALAPLSAPSRNRVMAWVSSVLSISQPAYAAQHVAHLPPASSAGAAGSVGHTSAVEFSSFADLFGDAGPVTDSDKALVGGYWLQVVQGAEDFVAQAVNEELKNTGNAVGNITRAFDALRGSKPQLVRQLEKSGKSQQARKKFKLTTAGIQRVQTMLKGALND